ncbi:methyl-accepting chemotaxis protein [Desulfovibrio mangrovi]|uniref:methyl-accepting chemotaxis protein n=1 Tax=Desulfovibrio mangrovi TaxID=2976983 RepID=UPI002245EF49|nr:methyl-accepting chemotaxis protein [Desulfovibrio mangrovi]UZP66304.1 methyl-accepting chemotaxis protein [Desulfovibrio mangrovi]
MQFLLRSLGIKVLFLVTVASVLSFSGLFLANSYNQKETAFYLIHDAAASVSDMLLSAIEDPMSVGDDAGTRAKFAHIREQYDNIDVYLTDFKGVVSYGTRETVERKELAGEIGNPTLAAIVTESLETPVKRFETLTIGDKPYFAATYTIENAESCHHCHGASRKILGSMVMLKDISSEMGMLHQAQYVGAGLSFAGMAGLIAVLLLFMKFGIVNRIRSITGISHEIEKGNYSINFSDSGTDELGVLSGNLAKMVETIRDQLQYNQSVLNGIIVPLVVVNKTQGIEYANSPIRAILGTNGSAGRETRLNSVLLGGGHDEDIADKVLATGRSTSGRMNFRRADGVQFPLQYEFSPLKDANGAVTGAIGVMIDLTQEEQDKARIEANRKNLLAVAEEVTAISMNLASAAQQLSSQMNEVTSNFEETAGQTSQVATAMEEMNVSVLEVSQSATSTAQLAEQASGEATQGGKEMGSTVQETKDMSSRAAELAGSLDALASSAQNIGNVIGVINDIADQTNLLALNAAIEAARAGEAGRGFAVVADEVRKLAEKTMTATREVEQAIVHIQESTRKAVQGMQETQQRSVRTAEKAGDTGAIFSMIVQRSEQMADMVRSIATASEQQSATSEEINRSINSINHLSQTIAGRIQEANEAIQEVAGMAHKLSAMVERFKE